jgi:serine/threonine-protein kinase
MCELLSATLTSVQRHTVPVSDAGSVGDSEKNAALVAQPSPDSPTLRSDNLSPSRSVPAAIALPTLPGYEILQVLGRGGMGVVYKARHLGLNRLVAIKMILAGVHASPSELARFRAEAKIVARLHHANIVQVYEIGSHEGRPYIVLELVEGSLARRLAGSALPPRQAADWLMTLARAVHYAHQQGIVHRDLKPGNILLGRDDTLKIADFGMAKIVAGRAASQTLTGAIRGTPSYMAPEQAEGDSSQIGPAIDIYGLGAILYELLTSQPPFQADSPRATLDQVLSREPAPPTRLRPNLPRDLETICLRCLSKDPRKRYASAAALADDLAAFLSGEPISARRPGCLERLTGWTKRQPAQAMLAAAGALACIGLAIGVVWSHPLAVATAAALSLLAGGCWHRARLHRIAQEAARQRRLAERSYERLHVMLEMTRRLTQRTNLDDRLRLIAETTIWLAHAELATIFLVDRRRGELWAKVTLDQTAGEIRMPLGVGIAGTVALSGEPITVADAYADPRFNPEIDRRTRHQTHNLCTLPMMARDGSVLGVFQVINKQDGAFGVDDVEILTELATSAAAAIEQTMVVPCIP